MNKPQFAETEETVLSDPKHWELLENRSIYKYDHAYVIIPNGVPEHLDLKNGDKVDIAIKRSREDWSSRKPHEFETEGSNSSSSTNGENSMPHP